MLEQASGDERLCHALRHSLNPSAYPPVLFVFLRYTCLFGTTEPPTLHW
jgi:hypothetical protein